MTNAMECDGLTVSVDGRVLIRDLRLSIEPGTIVCVLGRNGVGKTLTLHTLAGLRSALGGNIRLGGEALKNMTRRDVARRLGLLLQAQDDAFPITVLESVLMGRHARLDFWQWENDQDLLMATDALTVFGLSGFEQRQITTLSGGERRRVALAALLVQNPDVWLLDEPTNHLDPHHQLGVLEKLTDLARDGKSVLTTLHDPVLAARFSDFTLLLHGDGQWEYGSTVDLITVENLERLYQTPFESFQGKERQVLLPA